MLHNHSSDDNLSVFCMSTYWWENTQNLASFGKLSANVLTSVIFDHSTKFDRLKMFRCLFRSDRFREWQRRRLSAPTGGSNTGGVSFPHIHPHSTVDGRVPMTTHLHHGINGVTFTLTGLKGGRRWRCAAFWLGLTSPTGLGSLSSNRPGWLRGKRGCF